MSLRKPFWKPLCHVTTGRVFVILEPRPHWLLSVCWCEEMTNRWRLFLASSPPRRSKVNSAEKPLNVPKCHFPSTLGTGLFVRPPFVRRYTTEPPACICYPWPFRERNKGLRVCACVTECVSSLGPSLGGPSRSPNRAITLPEHPEDWVSSECLRISLSSLPQAGPDRRGQVRADPPWSRCSRADT